VKTSSTVINSIRMIASTCSVRGRRPEKNFSFRQGQPRQSRCVSLAFVLGVLFVCAAAPMAAAERAIAVDVPAAAPFEAGELRRALALRLSPEGVRVELRVALAGDGLVQIIAGERAREIDVAGLHGAAAARLVALAASDLLLDDLADAPPAPAGAARGPAMTVGALGAVSSWPHALAGGAVDVALASRSKLVAVELGGATLLAAGIRMTAMTARIAAGVRPHEAVELRAGLTLAPIFVSDGAGDRTALVGGHAVVRLRFPIGARIQAVLAAGADMFATRTEYRAGGMPLFATPRIAPSIGVGIEVTP
jgi:hypothetical protein